METHNGDPVNEIDRIEGIQIIVEECVVCGDSHFHGTGGKPPDVGEVTQRGAHCTDGGSYYLKRTEDTEVQKVG